MNKIKEFTEGIFCKTPKFYALVRRVFGSTDWEKQTFLKVIHSGFSIVEIGANQGYYTSLFQKLVGKNGTIHAFEPLPTTFELLEGSVRFDLPNIHLYNLGTFDTKGEFKFHLPKNDHGQATMSPHDCNSWKSREIKEVACSVIKLDEFTPISSLAKIDFIKIDVEGAELPSLQGAEHILRKHKPLLFVEVCKAWIKSFHYTLKEMDTFLTSLGYTNFEVIDSIPFTIKSIESFIQNKGDEESFNLLIS